MPLARANGCALTHPLSACCQQERTLRKAKPGTRRDLSTTKPAAKEIEAFAASALAERSQEAAVSQAVAARGDGNRGKRARPNHRAPPSPWVLRPISGSACASPASMKSRRSARSLWISAPPSGGSWVLRTLSIFDRREVALVSPRPVRGRGAIHLRSAVSPRPASGRRASSRGAPAPCPDGRR